MKQQKNKTTLVGQVVPYDFDEDDFYSIMLLVDGEETYIIEPGREGSRLEDFIDHWVTIQGTVRRKDEDLFLSVHSFKLDDELSYDEDW